MFSRYKSFKSEKIKEKKIQIGDEEEDEVEHPGVSPSANKNIISIEAQIQQLQQVGNINGMSANAQPIVINQQPLTTSTTQKVDSFAALAMRRKQSPSNLYSTNSNNNNCTNIKPFPASINATPIIGVSPQQCGTVVVDDSTRGRSNSSQPVVEHEPKVSTPPTNSMAQAAQQQEKLDEKAKSKEEEATTRRRAFSLQIFKKKTIEEKEEKKLEKNEKKFSIKEKEEFAFEDFYVRDKKNKLH